MHHTLNTSLIYLHVYSIHSKLYQNIKTTQKYFSWIFCIFTDICLSVIPFFILGTIRRFVLLLPPRDLIPSWGSTYRLVGSAWQVGCLPTQALKCQVNKYMQVKQNSCMPSLLSVFTHWGVVLLDLKAELPAIVANIIAPYSTLRRMPTSTFENPSDMTESMWSTPTPPPMTTES